MKTVAKVVQAYPLEKNGANKSSLLKNVLIRGVHDLRQRLSGDMEEGNTYTVRKKIT